MAGGAGRDGGAGAPIRGGMGSAGPGRRVAAHRGLRCGHPFANPICCGGSAVGLVAVLGPAPGSLASDPDPPPTHTMLACRLCRASSATSRRSTQRAALRGCTACWRAASCSSSSCDPAASMFGAASRHGRRRSTRLAPALTSPLGCGNHIWASASSRHSVSFLTLWLQHAPASVHTAETQQHTTPTAATDTMGAGASKDPSAVAAAAKQKGPYSPPLGAPNPVRPMEPAGSGPGIFVARSQARRPGSRAPVTQRLTAMHIHLSVHCKPCLSPRPLRGARCRAGAHGGVDRH